MSIFPVTINKIKGVDVVQTQKWGTVWNNPPAIDFGQIMGNLKLVDYYSVLSKEKMKKCLFACFGSQQQVLMMGKSLHFPSLSTYNFSAAQEAILSTYPLGYVGMSTSAGPIGDDALAWHYPPTLLSSPFSSLLHWVIRTWTIALHQRCFLTYICF